MAADLWPAQRRKDKFKAMRLTQDSIFGHMLCGIVMLHRVMCRIYVELQEKVEMNKNSTTAPLPSTLKLRNMCMHINVNIFFNLELSLIM